MMKNKKISKGVLESVLSLLKILMGGVIGFISGGFYLPPLYGLFLWIITISILVILFRFLLGLEDHPLKLSLMHGTFASFILFVFIWALMIGP